MLHHGSPFRVLVTLLVAVTVPFCCCNFHSLVSSCKPCEGHHSDAGMATVTHEHAHDHTRHDLTHEHATEHGPGNSDQHSAPCSPENEKQDCSCGNHDAKMFTVQKSTLELPSPMVVAVLNWALASETLPPPSLRGLERDLRAVHRPTTSLLRMHCALTV